MNGCDPFKNRMRKHSINKMIRERSKMWFTAREDNTKRVDKFD